ncbi:MAG: hypothetical protein WBG36_05475 [Ornithinimicrobium sp.]
MTRGSDHIPKLVFDTPRLRGQCQFELFHDATSPLFDTKPRRPLKEFRAAATDFMVNNLVLSSTAFAAQTLHRTRRHASRGDTDWLAVIVARSGSLHGEVGRSTVTISPRTVTLVDLSEPFMLRTDGADLRWACLPRTRRLDSRWTREASPVVAWATQTPQGRSIAATIEHVWSRVHQDPESQAAPLAGQIVDTVTAALETGVFSAPGRGAVGGDEAVCR